MPTITRIENYQLWSPDELKSAGYQKDTFGFPLESDQWVNWVLLVTLLLVLSLELLWTSQFSASADRSLSGPELPKNVSAIQN
jgi:hypothetical protein